MYIWLNLAKTHKLHKTDKLPSLSRSGNHFGQVQFGIDIDMTNVANI